MHKAYSLETHTLSIMTKKLNFEFKWGRLIEKIKNSEVQKVYDVDLMEELGFSPTSWKVWKPKFIEKAIITKFTDKMDDDRDEYHIINYDKKKKIWSYPKYSEEELEEYVAKNLD